MKTSPEFLAYQVEYRKKNKERISRQRRAFYAANRERICRDVKRYREMNPTKSRHRPGYQLKRRYGLSLEKYEEMVRSQGGNCALCEMEPDSRGLFVDHDHKCCPTDVTCGMCTRGLLCNNCNWAISAVEKVSHWATKAERYLGKS